MPVNEEVVPGPLSREVIDKLPDESGLTAYLVTRLETGARLRSGPFDISR